MEGITRDMIIRSSILDEMEVSYIVDEYLKLVRTKFSQYKYYLNEQSAVDWFGRTVRTPPKIFQYMRYEALANYDHLISMFGSAKACEPFETKPSHFKTKEFPSECNDSVPEDVKGLVTLHVYSDKEFERNMAELGLSSLIKRPPVPLCPNFSDDDDSRDVQPSTRVIDALNRNIDMESEDSNLSVECLGQPGFFHRSNFLIAYTPIRYVEVLGHLRGYAEKTKNGVAVRDDSEYWDRPIRIRLSYRKRIADNHVEFALILYESGHGSTEAPTNLRRNLMLEFNEVSNVTLSTRPEEDEDIVPQELGNNDQIPSEIFHAVIASEGISRTRIVNEIENLNVDSSALNVEILGETPVNERIYGAAEEVTDTTTPRGTAAAPDIAVVPEPLVTPPVNLISVPSFSLVRRSDRLIVNSMEGVHHLDSPETEDEDEELDHHHRNQHSLSEVPMDTSLDGETVIGSVTTPTSDSLAQVLEQASMVPMRTPTKTMPETPATPKRRPRHSSSLKRCNLTPTAPPPKRNAARSLRL